MGRRVVSTVGLWLAVIALLWWAGPMGGTFLLALLAAASHWELEVILRRLDYRPHQRLGVTFGIFIVLGSYFLPAWTNVLHFSSGTDLLIVAVIICSLRSLFQAKEISYLRSLMPTLFAIVLVPYTLQFLVALFWLPQSTVVSRLPWAHPENTGMLLAIWVVAVVKFCDVGALLWGMALGKHPFSPNLSPKKTWEGVFGGILTGILVGVGFRLLAHEVFPSTFDTIKAALIALPVAVAGIAGDLLESAIKREAAVKDSGQLIPGIGGALDLTDSLILSAPLAYFLFKYLVFT